MSLRGRLARLSVRWKVFLTVVVAAAVGLGIWLVFFFFAFQTYFIDDKVDEAAPVFESGAGAVSSPTSDSGGESSDSGSSSEDGSGSEDGSTATDGAETGDSGSQSGIPGDDLSDEVRAEMDEAMEGEPEEVPAAEPTPDMPQIVVEVSGDFVNRSHPTRGVAEVLGDGTGQRFLRFEDFRTDNGPDLNVYLSTAPPDAPASQFDDDFIDLGDLKGNVGSQNYEIPRDVDLSRYSTVVIWCVRFAVIFGAAPLA